jgi:hypothetical protein
MRMEESVSPGDLRVISASLSFLDQHQPCPVFFGGGACAGSPWHQQYCLHQVWLQLCIPPGGECQPDAPQPSGPLTVSYVLSAAFQAEPWEVPEFSLLPLIQARVNTLRMLVSYDHTSDMVPLR